MSSKQVQIIARVTIKRNGHVVYVVRSSKGDTTYNTTIIDGHATGCTCPSYKPCYHMSQLEAIEAKRVVVKVGERVVSGVNADHAVSKALRLLTPAYDVLVEAEKVAAHAVESPEKEVEMSEEIAPVAEESNDVSAAQHIIDGQVDTYEGALRYPVVTLNDLRIAARNAGLRVKMVKGQGHKETHIQALVKHRRMMLEMQAEAEALEALPEQPTVSPQVAPLQPCEALDEADLLLDSGERAAVYLATETKPVIYQDLELPKVGKARKFENAALGGTRAFSMMR